MLHVAAQGDSPYSVAYFKKMGIAINSRDREMSTPLHWACISQSHNVIQYLLAFRADVNAKDSAGYTPLHLAVKDIEKHKNYKTIKKLLFKGANPYAKDIHGRRPVDMANFIIDFRVKSKVLRLLSKSQTCC